MKKLNGNWDTSLSSVKLAERHLWNLRQWTQFPDGIKALD